MIRSPADEPLVRFLLGDLPEDERAHVEDEFSRDEDLFLRLKALERELADDYVRGELDPHARSRYEATLATMPHRRGQVEFARELFQVLSEEAPRTKPARPLLWRWAAAAVVLVALAAGILLRQFDQRTAAAERALIDISRHGERLNRELAESRRIVRELEAEFRAPQSRTPPARAVAVVAFLTPGLVRGGVEPVRLVVPATADSLRLQLDIEGDSRHSSYRAKVLTAGGRLVWGATGLRPRRGDRGPMLVVALPASLIVPGEYEIVLQGVQGGLEVEDVAQYHFSAAR